MCITQGGIALKRKQLIRSKMALALAGLMVIGTVSLPVNAEELTITGEAIAWDGPQEEDGTSVQAYPDMEAAPVGSVAVKSGRLDIRPLTKTEIANLCLEAELNSTPLSFDIEPHIGAPYAAGRASAANRQSALDNLNMYRQIASLTPVLESEELSDEAQHGAVILAALNTGLSHYPDKPADMEEDFYQIAYKATSSSNLSGAYGYSDYRMEYGVDSCMWDKRGNNLTSVGHRRWFLNPRMLYVGLGQAVTSHDRYGTAYYFDYKVFDRSNEELDYDFIAWPSSGNFPLELSLSKLPWSISLNPSRYAVPSLTEVVVEITNPAGETETFSAADNTSDTSGNAKYFNVNTGGYGEGACIICNFGGNYEDYSQPGDYRIKVSGLRSALSGEPVSIDYHINMFLASDYAGKTAVTDGQYEKIEEFVERLYTKCLERSSEPLGKLNWTMWLADRDVSGAGAGQGFVFSDEYLSKGTTDDAFLDMMYEVYLGRTADAAGKENWSNMLSNGVSRQYVFKGFAESVEYGGICEQYGIERGDVTLTEGRDLNPGATMFVYRIYDKALNRTPDVDGMNTWAGAIARGEMSAEFVAQQFFHSDEYLGKGHTDEEYLKVLYRTFMDREAEENGLNFWLQYLQDGHTRDEVLVGFSGSDEFKDIMASYGL